MRTSVAVTVVSRRLNGVEVFFAVADPEDLIQRRHMRGQFYEPEELAIIAAHFRPGGVFLDVGANVGNHSVYVGAYLRPARIIVVEPNPPAIALLRINVRLNQLGGVVDERLLGCGFADRAMRGEAVAPPGNLGAARLRERVGEDAPARRPRPQARRSHERD